MHTLFPVAGGLLGGSLLLSLFPSQLGIGLALLTVGIGIFLGSAIKRTPEDRVAVIRDSDGYFVKLAGPGWFFLWPSWKVEDYIDTTTQYRHFTVAPLHCQEGIEARASVVCPFRVDPYEIVRQSTGSGDGISQLPLN